MGRRYWGTGAWLFGVGCGICATVAFLGPSTGRYVFPHGGAASPATVMDGAASAEDARDWGPLVPAEIQRILKLEPHTAREEERNAVLGFVQAFRSEPEFSAIQQADLRWVIDGLLMWLRREGSDGDALAVALAEIARKEEAPPELREISLVHLGLCRVSEVTRERVGRVLSQVGAEHPTRPWVGSALGLLGREVFVAAQPEWVRERCLELAADPQAHVLCRIAAFDLAALRGWQEAEPLARIQSVSAAAATERVAALHALAEVGNEDTLRWLEKWEQPQDPFLAACLDATRRRLRARGPKF